MSEPLITKRMKWKNVLSYFVAAILITISALNRAHRISSSRYLTILNNSTKLMLQEKYPEALASAEKLLDTAKSKNEKAEANVLLASVQIKLGNLDAAEMYLKAAKKINPSYKKLDDIFATLYLLKSKQYYNDKDYEKALEFDKIALDHTQAGGDKGYIHYVMSVALNNLNRSEEASAEEALSIQLSTSTAGLISLDSIQSAKSFWSNGQYDKMLLPANKALQYAQTDEQKGFAHYWLGVAYLRLGQLNKAEEEEKMALNLIPKVAGPNVTMSAILSALGQPRQALKFSQKAVELEPNYAWAHNSLGLVLYEIGHKGDAIKELEKAAQLDPNTSLFRLNLTRIREN